MSKNGTWLLTIPKCLTDRVPIHIHILSPLLFYPPLPSRRYNPAKPKIYPQSTFYNIFIFTLGAKCSPSDYDKHIQYRLL
ncbi:hypothetical protein FKM82_020329 [Ascaphus truei]